MKRYYLALRTLISRLLRLSQRRPSQEPMVVNTTTAKTEAESDYNGLLDDGIHIQRVRRD